MPKRIPTPPPSDDEPRYLTVVHPYAIDGTCNMELPKDRIDFAHWVASCINKNAFFAIFHKPSSRRMAIIEINRDYPHLDKILGEHRWSEFLQNPTKEESGQVTQVFHCTYNTGRIVQKNGWKRIDVDDGWFKAWTPKNRNIKHPYPPTHFCDVPVEDRTNHALCRPLPGAVKPPPPVEDIVAPQPVVGSAAWIQARDGGTSAAPVTAQSKPNALGAWGKGAPKAPTTAKPDPAANESVKKTDGVPQRPHTGTRMPAVGGGTVVAKASNVWQDTSKQAQIATNWDESTPVSREATPMSPAIMPPTAPPGLAARKSARESGAPSPLPGLAVPGSKPATECPGSVSAGASTDSDAGPDLTTATESDDPYRVHTHFSETMEEEFHGMRIRAMEDEEDENLGELDAIAPGNWDALTGAGENLTLGWNDNDDLLEAEDLWRQNQEAAQTPVLCNSHGVICKKGICAEYANQLRIAKRAAEEKRRAAAVASKRKKSGRGKNAGKKKDVSRDNDAANKIATQNNPFRGPGAPVTTNWRGAPRALVSTDNIDKGETTKAASDDEWGNSDSENGPNAAVVTTDTTDAASDANCGVSESTFDPRAANKVPQVAKADGKPQAKKAAASSDWAEQVEAEFAASGNADAFTTISPKHGRGSKRGTSSTASWGTSAAKSSTSGWGSVPDMPW